jgi:hypothetical protein
MIKLDRKTKQEIQFAKLIRDLTPQQTRLLRNYMEDLLAGRSTGESEAQFLATR